VAAAIVTNIKDNFAKFLDPKIWDDFFNRAKDLGSSFATFLGSALKDSLKFAVDFFKWAIIDMNLFDLIYEQISPLFQKIGEGFEGLGLKKLDYAAMRNQYRSDFAQVQIDREQKKEESMNNIPTFSLSDETKSAFSEVTKDLGEAFKSLLDTVAGLDVQELYTEEYDRDLQKLEITITEMTQTVEKTDNEIEVLSKSMDEVQEDIAETEKAFDSLGAMLGDKLGAVLGEKMGAAGELLGQSLGNIADLFGDVSTAINAIFTGNPIGLIITLVSRLFDVFSEISGPFAAFMNIFDVFFDVVKDICAVLEPALSAIFTPILDVVRALARVFGMFMNALIPILSILFLRFIPVLKILEPVLNGIAWVFAALADGLAVVYNFISDVVNGITFGLINMGKLATNNRDRLQDSINVDQNYDSYKNNSTSYSVSGDMYINISFSHSYVNGDARAIALAIRDEIRLAEAGGY
jgi:hypothetical protein